MTIYYEVSKVGYKADESAPDGYTSQVFTKVISISTPEKLKEIEDGTTVLPDGAYPVLPKGWVETPFEITKKPRYEFKPILQVDGIKVVE